MTRQISREEYERLFGPAQQAAVETVAGRYLAERAFDEAYARLVIQGASHEDAVRAAQQQLYGQVRSLSVGAQGPENRRAVADYVARRQAGGEQAPPPQSASILAALRALDNAADEPPVSPRAPMRANAAERQAMEEMFAPHVAPRPSAVSRVMPSPRNARMAGQLLAAVLAGGGGLVGAALSSGGSE